jgi:hypothetical protein
MKTCNKCAECKLYDETILEKIASDNLSDEERVYFNKHLQSCEKCNSYLIFSKDLEKNLKFSGNELSLKEDFFTLNKGIIIGKIQNEKIQRIYFSKKVKWFAMAAIITGFLLYFGMFIPSSNKNMTLITSSSYENFFNNFHLIEKPEKLQDKDFLKDLETIEKSDKILQELLQYDYKQYHRG